MERSKLCIWDGMGEMRPGAGIILGEDGGLWGEFGVSLFETTVKMRRGALR